ncbi:MAG: hypothetical protein PVI97_20755 [Candidatus Thiodiazotropha sp.]|jgi:hypothetical protein
MDDNVIVILHHAVSAAVDGKDIRQLLGAIALIGSSIAGGIALGPMVAMMAALAIAVGLHIALLELAFNPDAKWDDVKGEVILAVSAVMGISSLAGNTATVIAFIIGFLFGHESNN